MQNGTVRIGRNPEPRAPLAFGILSLVFGQIVFFGLMSCSMICSPNAKYDTSYGPVGFVGVLMGFRALIFGIFSFAIANRFRARAGSLDDAAKLVRILPLVGMIMGIFTVSVFGFYLIFYPVNAMSRSRW